MSQDKLIERLTGQLHGLYHAREMAQKLVASLDKKTFQLRDRIQKLSQKRAGLE